MFHPFYQLLALDIYRATQSELPARKRSSRYGNLPTHNPCYSILLAPRYSFALNDAKLCNTRTEDEGNLLR
jgi:hypothetical protein